MTNKELNKKLIKTYGDLINYIENNFDLEINPGLSMTKENLEKVYTQSVIIDVINHSKAIISLVKEDLPHTAILHSRKLLETYPQVRLVKKLNIKKIYQNFFEFADFSMIQNIKDLLENDDVIEKSFKESLKEGRDLHIKNKTEEKYTNSLEKVIEEFNKNFPNDKKPNEDPIQWLGYGPKKMAYLFKDASKELYLKLYHTMSEHVHPTAGGYFNSIIKRTSEESPLIYGIHMSNWIAQLLTDDDEIKKELEDMMKEFDNLIQEYNESK